MKKISLLIMFMLFVSAGAMAKSVVFTLSNGKKVYYLLGGETNPMMRFVEGKIVVNADEYEITGIKNFYISETDDPVGVEQVLAEEKVSFRSNCLVVKSDAESVSVYTIGGAKVDADVTSENGYVNVNLSGLQSGNYVVKVGNSSFKVSKK